MLMKQKSDLPLGAILRYLPLLCLGMYDNWQIWGVVQSCRGGLSHL